MSHVAQKLTALLPVDAIEPALPFWQALGFKATVEMPHGGGLGFVILSNDRLELMYQTRASMADDVPALSADAASARAFLFVEVANIDDVEHALAGYPVVLARRQTFYGATEIGYREPGGHCITFAQFGQGAG